MHPDNRGFGVAITMSETATKTYGHLAALAGLPPTHRLVRLAEREHRRLMRSLGGTASERELWLIEQCVLRLVEREAASDRVR